MNAATERPAGRRARTRRWSTALLAAALAVATAGGVWWDTDRRADARAAAAAAAAVTASGQEHARRDKDIVFYAARAAGDPQGAFDRAHLASLYVRRARETSGFEDYLRAEALAREAIGLRTTQNGQAFVMLVLSLTAQHRFAEAREAARQLVAAEPDVEAYRALLGETCLELGDYAGARAAFESISGPARQSLAVAPRLARWAEIRGDTAQARAIVRNLVQAAGAMRELPREQLAWFHLRAADLELRQGRPRHAERALRAGLAIRPEDHRLLAAMARLAAVRHDWEDAIQYGDSAIAIVLDPTTLGLVSDAYAALGDTARAAEYVTAMEAAVGQEPGAYHRAWSLFLLDHGRGVPEVLAAAQAELAGRRDIHGYDLLAWALYKSGRPHEARRAMAGALAQGTQDPMLLYHAGMIARAAGDPAAARDYLQRALAIAPSFDHAAPAIARAALDSLRRAAPGS